MSRTPRTARRGVAAAALLVLPALALPALTGTASAAPRDTPAPITRTTGQQVAGSWIVTLQQGADARGVARRYAAQTRHVYSAALNGFAAQLNDGQVRALRNDRDVVALEPDQVVRADATQSVAAGGGLYGLDRTDQRALPLSGSYTYTGTGSGVRAYVIDTGIATAHADFGGRASNVYDAFGGNGQDCNGHGTHVAGTIGGATYGLAKSAALRGVKVLDCSGSGATSGIIAGIDWVRVNHLKPAVANMSLGGGYSSALNTATNNLSAAGVFVAVAAGNENQNACNVSPGRRPARRRWSPPPTRPTPARRSPTTAAAWRCTPRASTSRRPGSTAAPTPSAARRWPRRTWRAWRRSTRAAATRRPARSTAGSSTTPPRAW